MCLFAFLKPKFEFEGIFGNVFGHLLRIKRGNLKVLVFLCILGGYVFSLYIVYYREIGDFGSNSRLKTAKFLCLHLPRFPQNGLLGP